MIITLIRSKPNPNFPGQALDKFMGQVRNCKAIAIFILFTRHHHHHQSLIPPMLGSATWILLLHSSLFLAQPSHRLHLYYLSESHSKMQHALLATSFQGLLDILIVLVPCYTSILGTRAFFSPLSVCSNHLKQIPDFLILGPPTDFIVYNPFLCILFLVTL